MLPLTASPDSPLITFSPNRDHTLTPEQLAHTTAVLTSIVREITEPVWVTLNPAHLTYRYNPDGSVTLTLTVEDAEPGTSRVVEVTRHTGAATHTDIATWRDHDYGVNSHAHTWHVCWPTSTDSLPMILATITPEPTPSPAS